jgi:hypothetical protein
MKKALFIILAVLMITACKKDSISYEDDYEKSYKAWLSYKQRVNNSYSYVVTWGSWAGFGEETTLNITDGKITSRSYKAYRRVYDPSGSSANVLVKTWDENEATLNTHANEGAQLLTLDDVYAKAKSVWLVADKKTNDIYFEARHNGLISGCSFVPKGCQDDCSIGINIKTITPTP